jgi:hypothetical protein
VDQPSDDESEVEAGSHDHEESIEFDDDARIGDAWRPSAGTSDRPRSPEPVVDEPSPDLAGHSLGHDEVDAWAAEVADPDRHHELPAASLGGYEAAAPDTDRWRPRSDSGVSETEHLRGGWDDTDEVTHDAAADVDRIAGPADFGREDEFDREQRPAASFDIDGAVSGAGYFDQPDVHDRVGDHSMPEPIGGAMSMDEDEFDERRTRSGIFSKTASERFASVAGAIRERTVETGGGSGGEDDEEEMSVADQIMASQEQLRAGARTARFTPDVVKKVAIGAGVLFVLAGIALSIPAMIGFLADQVEPTATTTIAAPTTVPAPPPTTVVEPPTPDGGSETSDQPTVPVSDFVFDLTPAEFVERWDSVASGSLLIGDGLSGGRLGMGFTRYVGLEVSTSDDGTMASYRVVLDPDGDTNEDVRGLQALGVAINVAEPTLEGADLRARLASMGLDVSNPVLDFDGETTVGGVHYRLVYDEARELVTLTVEEPGAAAAAEEG